MHAVVGTTGFSQKDYDRLRKEFTKSNCIVAPNFAIGAVLMMRFAEMAAPYFESAEVIELHHDAEGRRPVRHGHAHRRAHGQGLRRLDRRPHHRRGGRRRPRWSGRTHPIHSVRLQGLVAHQEVMLGTMGQSLTIRHDSYDRSSFMPGVLLAVKKVADTAGLTVGLDNLLGL